jgi:hypothetical protein
VRTQGDPAERRHRRRRLTRADLEQREHGDRRGPPLSAFLAGAIDGGVQVTGIATIRDSVISANRVEAVSEAGIANAAERGIGSLSGRLTLERTAVSGTARAARASAGSSSAAASSTSRSAGARRGSRSATASSRPTSSLQARPSHRREAASTRPTSSAAARSRFR